MSECKNMVQSRDSNSERAKLTTRGMAPQTSRLPQEHTPVDIDYRLVEIPKMVNRAQQTSAMSKYNREAEIEKH
eukprot:CAMPEP_0185587178 /NCGR_PEP_ID=MMETSP0434-20130131/47848_1 /TAXON_ID=626734 ORGANISM="Favella taraikaensis, Strain Fe Narragansett Bay" /NCGR_SAMPLE_ID=MMETSP0434 /ASSEMBLY_ACC=CAM_ASM_000379 /LENGTH=73 /DNA_ID=CAMNT_0028208873 /DNA_START=176 /DNA_END=397 /DNA_ORIENTATION=-